MAGHAVPPPLLPGMSARRWLQLLDRWGVLGPIVFIAFAVYVGYIVPTQAGRDVASRWWLAAIVVIVVGWIVLVLGFRRAAYRERAAGYTTIGGSHVLVPLWRTSVRLFPTTDLWLLDARSGAARRRPGEPTR
jgi:hypothetical protein